MTEIVSDNYGTPHESIKEYRYAVYFESQALWKEKDPVCRANIARQVAEWAVILADLEEQEAKRFKECD